MQISTKSIKIKKRDNLKSLEHVNIFRPYKKKYTIMKIVLDGKGEERAKNDIDKMYNIRIMTGLSLAECNADTRNKRKMEIHCSQFSLRGNYT